MQIQEDMHTFKLKCGIELTVMDETMCLEFLEKRKPWLGVCYTKEHATLLRKRIIQGMWNKFTTESSEHYKPALAGLLHKAGLHSKAKANPTIAAATKKGVVDAKKNANQKKRRSTAKAASAKKQPKKAKKALASHK